MPIISVIVPVYNVEKYLARCLDSILNQTFTDFEVICVNDGSKDESLAILQEYAQKDARIIVMDQENQGQSVARNKAMKIAQGEYILFVDSDDAIEKQCLEIAHTLIIEHQADVVAWRYDTSNGTECPSKLFDTQSIETVITTDMLSHYQTTPYSILHNPWSRLCRKSCIESISFPEGLYYQDACYTWELMLSKPKTVIIKEPLYLYTINPISTSIGFAKQKHITDYHKIILLISNLVKHSNTEYARDIFIRKAIPSFLRIQINRISVNPIDTQLPLWIAFEEELRDIVAKEIFPTYDKKRKKQFDVYNYILKHGAKAYYQNNIVSWRKKPFCSMKTSTSRSYYIFGMKIFAKEKLAVKHYAIHILGMTFKYGKKTS